jgi:multisubunit Na+/H+ antiporter MnhE subunit
MRERGTRDWLVRLSTWAGLFLFWMLLVATLAPSEVAAGLVAATIGTVASEVVRRQRMGTFRPRLRWLLRTWRLPWLVLAEFGVVSLALWRHLIGRKRLRGTFRAVPFPSRADDPTGAARRAAATVGGSLAPNAYVVGFAEDADLMLVHELAPTHPPSETLRFVRPR